MAKYACPIGHTYTGEAMAAAQFDDMEKVMGSAERIFNERAGFCRRMTDWIDASRESSNGELWRAASQEALARAYILRDFIEQDWLRPQGAAPMG